MEWLRLHWEILRKTVEKTSCRDEGMNLGPDRQNSYQVIRKGKREGSVLGWGCTRGMETCLALTEDSGSGGGGERVETTFLSDSYPNAIFDSPEVQKVDPEIRFRG